MKNPDWRIYSVTCFCMSVLAGCAGTSPVVKTANGNYTVTGYGSTHQRSRNGALKAAARECGRTRAHAVVVSEETRYQGLISAEVNKAVKVAGRVARAAGNAEASKTLGAAVSDDGFETDVNFVCE